MGFLKSFTPLFFIFSLSLMIFPLIEVHAADKTLNNSIGIDISKQCRSMIINNFTTNCPTIQTLFELNIDTSNKRISGEFGFKDGLFQRLPSQHKNTYGIYIFDETFRIFIDPPGEIATRVKMITIENTLDTYILQTNMDKTNDERTINKYRFVNDSCTKAVIGGNTWTKTLPDTINFLRNNCDERFTNFKSEFVVKDPTTNQDIRTSQKYKEDKWKKESKSSYKSLKIGNDTRVNPSVIEDRDPKYIPPKTPPFNYTKYR